MIKYSTLCSGFCWRTSAQTFVTWTRWRATSKTTSRATTSWWRRWPRSRSSQSVVSCRKGSRCWTSTKANFCNTRWRARRWLNSSNGRYPDWHFYLIRWLKILTKTWGNLSFFKNGPLPASFSFIFGLTIQFFTSNQCKKCHVHPVYGAGIRTHDPWTWVSSHNHRVGVAFSNMTPLKIYSFSIFSSLLQTVNKW